MDAKLEQLRTVLKTKESALQQVLRRRDGIAVERSADPSDEAQLALDRELSIHALDHDSCMLHDVRLALRRMSEGCYGICDACDGEISEKRLAAMPWAKYCIACQDAIDRARDRDEELPVAS
jgi:DnaK suppressor protein